jgi:hypothetical protein
VGGTAGLGLLALLAVVAFAPIAASSGFRPLGGDDDIDSLAAPEPSPRTDAVPA